VSLRRPSGEWRAPILRSSSQTGPNRFCFLNQEREIASWNDPDASKLWLYNLHYFEHVNDELVDRWIASNPPAEAIGWDPYPTSLRIANWCKWILGGAQPARHVLESLAGQAYWIERRIEWHLLANHVLANAKALIFAGALFEGDSADRWMQTGMAILRQELPRQILSDGAHCERSPMYHSIILEDLLDLYNLRQARAASLPDLSGYASRMLGWLDQMVHPDGQISFFNDAVLGIAPRRDELRLYADRLGIQPQLVQLGESGYRRLSHGGVTAIFDAAPLGPDYQPGHGHADALSFEASFHGRRVLVNSGTSTYDTGALRSFQVGTAAHNTIRIDGCDQSEMWGAFRVARRAMPFDLTTDGSSVAEAAHDGYHRLHPKVTHRRRLELTADGLKIVDWLQGSGRHEVELFLHLAPGVAPAIEIDPKMTRRDLATEYFPRFNTALPNQTVIGRWSGDCPVRFETRIRFKEQDALVQRIPDYEVLEKRR
jgi:uncharacterized heparinase superfamily protein